MFQTVCAAAVGSPRAPRAANNAGHSSSRVSVQSAAACCAGYHEGFRVWVEGSAVTCPEPEFLRNVYSKPHIVLVSERCTCIRWCNRADQCNSNRQQQQEHISLQQAVLCLAGASHSMGDRRPERPVSRPVVCPRYRQYAGAEMEGWCC
jgi:hypothetical protein